MYKCTIFVIPSTTGGVSFTVGGAAAPLTLCFATSTFGIFGGFLTPKQWFLTSAMQIWHICRHFGIQFLVFIP